MKRILSLALTAVMLFALCIPLHADGKLSISMDNVEIVAGETARVTVSVSGNVGMVCLVLQTSYDKSVFTTGPAIDGDFGNITKGTVSAGNKWVFATDYNVDTNGDFVSFDLTVSEDAEPGTYPITLIVKELFDDSFTDIEYEVSSATVNVLPGPTRITFDADEVTVDADNIDSFRQTDGSLIVPVPVRAKKIPADNGMAAFNIVFSSDAEIVSVDAGSAIANTDVFQVGPDYTNIWVDTNEITAADAEIAVVNLKIPHEVTAPSAFNVQIAASDDPDDFLLIDKTTYVARTAGGSVTVSVSAHVAGDAVRENEVPATCTVNGSYNEVVRCTICGEILSSEPRTIEAGHKYVPVVTPPTCTEKGYTTYTCSECNDSYTADEVPANGHDPGSPVRENEVPATCTASGSYDEVVYCTVCHAELSRDHKTIDPIPHDLIHFDRIEVTVRADGSIEYWKCSVCEKLFSDAEGKNEIAAADVVIPKLPAPVKGDVDGDGKVNAQDVIMIMRYLVGWRDETLDTDVADYNGDGKLNNRDVYLIMKDIVDSAIE